MNYQNLYIKINLLILYLLFSSILYGQNSKQFIWNGQVQTYHLEENLEETKIYYKDVITLLGKENESYYLLFHYKKGLNFLKVNSNYELKIENNELKFSKNNQLTYSFEYAIINQDLVIYLPNELKNALSIVQYQPLHQNLDEEVKLKYVSLYSIEDFDLSLKEPILPIEFKMLISSVSSEKLIEPKDISIAFIHHLLKNKKYTFAKYAFNNYYSEEKKQSYLNQNKTINNLLFFALDNNDIDLLSKIPEQYLSKLFETEDGLKLNSLGYAIIKMKPEMVKYLSKKMNDGMICIQDDKENKNYKFNEALQLVTDKDQFIVYFERVIKTMPYVVTD